jgi:hypothetical protein
MAPPISGTHLLDPAVIDEPYGFYEELRVGAPVWEVPGVNADRNGERVPVEKGSTSVRSYLAA